MQCHLERESVARGERVQRAGELLHDVALVTAAPILLARPPTLVNGRRADALLHRGEHPQRITDLFEQRHGILHLHA